jgi:hypothetical protein
MFLQTGSLDRFMRGAHLFLAVPRTRIGERMNLQFRSELFDIVDHPNLVLPNLTVQQSAFGAMASVLDGANGNPLGHGSLRLLQFVLKSSF